MALSLLCALTYFTGPAFKVEELHLQVNTRNKASSKAYPGVSITYYLYTQDNPDTPDVLQLHDDQSIKSSHINFENPTVAFFHDESYQNDEAVIIKNNYLKVGKYNVILMDASRLLAGVNYVTATVNVGPIGRYSAQFIDYLVTQGLSLSRLHVMGMSLGGQAVGVVGQNVKSGKLKRITGLDPAGPLFYGKPANERLDKTDAEFVDVIHTSSGTYGFNAECGHVDFWVNGGSSQPGCSLVANFTITDRIFCNHLRAFRLYAETILDPKALPAQSCNSWSNFTKGNCDENPVEYMGIAVDPTTARGNYYLRTRGSYPYTLNQN